MKNHGYPRYRWIISLIMLLSLLGLNILWFVPSPLLVVIMTDLHLSLTQGGLGMSVVCLLVAAFSLAGGKLVERWGAKRCLLIGLMFMASGALFTLVITNFGMLFISRVLVGIGFGLCLPISGVIIMEWFPAAERPYLNTVNSALPYIASAITFAVTVPLFLFLHSWRLSIVIWGFYLLLIAIIWALIGKDKETEKATAHLLPGMRPEKLYRSVWNNREVKLLAIAEAGDMWAFQFLSSMLPTYYTTEGGLSLTAASNITVVFPLTGIAAGLLCGFWMSRVGLRRPFTWTNHLCTFIGTLLAISGAGWLPILGVALAGFGNAGWAPALFTMPMEFENMTPTRVGAVYAIVLGLGFIAAFVSPWLGGWLAQKISLHNTILLFSFSSLVAAFCTFMMKETGPRARNQLPAT